MRKLTWGEALEREFSILFIIFILAFCILLPFAGVAIIIFGLTQWIVIGWVVSAILVSLWGLYCTRNDNVKCIKCGVVIYHRSVSDKESKKIKCQYCTLERRTYSTWLYISY